MQERGVFFRLPLQAAQEVVNIYLCLSQDTTQSTDSQFLV